MSDHSFHRCQDERCNACEGGLKWCIVCRGAEGSLPTDCPGVRMTDGQEADVYAARLDYRDGAWSVIVCAAHQGAGPCSFCEVAP